MLKAEADVLTMCQQLHSLGKIGAGRLDGHILDESRFYRARAITDGQNSCKRSRLHS